MYSSFMVLIWSLYVQKRLQRYKKNFISANLRDEKWAVCQFVPKFSSICRRLFSVFPEFGGFRIPTPIRKPTWAAMWTTTRKKAVVRILDYRFDEMNNSWPLIAYCYALTNSFLSEWDNTEGILYMELLLLKKPKIRPYLFPFRFIC